MSSPPLISSQRYLNRDVIARKAATFKVFVVRTVTMEIRGKHYRVLLDGHHNLAAARLVGAEPTWKGPAPKFERIMKHMSADSFAAFMINNLTDSDWYFHDTGEVVADLLAPQL
ncbi:hypothetical protein DKY63_29485 [Pseudomonas putida]|uniref:Chromosome partitioning protein ParB n=1 Tax=Pseudomonas putida TaxID=303 RepID=A0A2Z4RRP4_PSEPU|nr:hypothetical protein [Pseudomonas putida]AWY43823.1 hypothetical protein DKY63_29485 [Pseudomonas putida]